nr:MAG TPA: hypothetical protein [Caudoviricetes sp.]
MPNKHRTPVRNTDCKGQKALKKSYERCATDFYDKRQVPTGLYLA